MSRLDSHHIALNLSQYNFNRWMDFTFAKYNPVGLLKYLTITSTHFVKFGLFVVCFYGVQIGPYAAASGKISIKRPNMLHANTLSR